MILKINSDVKNVDLSHLYKYVDQNDCFQYFQDDTGVNHCKLLAFVSYQLPPGSKVADLGTFLGQSAVPLAANPDVNVTTYDIDDVLINSKMSCKDMKNVQFVKQDCLACVDQYADATIVFLDIAPHDGDQEQKVLVELQKRNFRGLLICDDTLYSDAMKSWWASVPLKKYDVTSYGHWSGTGIIVFDPSYIDVEIT